MAHRLSEAELEQHSRRRFTANQQPAAALDRERLIDQYCLVRQQTEALIEGLSTEDQNLQSMPEASPVKWHRAHTTWFFETFVLEPRQPDFRPVNPHYRALFNSYYNGIGEQFARPRRSLISRPDVEAIGRYRQQIDQAMIRLITDCPQNELGQLASLVVLGLNHEQQHQELVITDLKHALSFNPLAPTPAHAWQGPVEPAALTWQAVNGGLIEIGADPEAGFAFDNETPRHRIYIEDFELASRPVNCGEYLDFIADGGYDNPMLWLSDGWAWRQENAVQAPLYWRFEADESPQIWTLSGQRELDMNEPVCHISFYEAFAFAEWAGFRLPTEAEWEWAARNQPVKGHFADSRLWHPRGAQGNSPGQLFGDVWEWTASAYAPYPGFDPPAGALGEYNGKFMANQMVLRGGSCATPAGHVRASYRNFFYPADRWQFSGLRLARSTP